MSVIEKRQDARREVVRELYEGGLPVKEIAEHVDASVVTVYHDLRVLKLRVKGEYSPLHREAISKGIRKIKAIDKIMKGGKLFCCVCGVRTTFKNRFKQKDFCDLHLITAYANPNYEEEQRAAAGQRFASHGRTI